MCVSRTSGCYFICSQGPTKIYKNHQKSTKITAHPGFHPDAAAVSLSKFPKMKDRPKATVDILRHTVRSTWTMAAMGRGEDGDV